MSNETQLSYIRPWCEARRHEIVAVYQDEFKSGGSLDGREGFQKALEHVKRIKGILVCYSLSRFARCARDALNLAHELDQAGAYLGLLDFGVDSSEPTGRLLFTIIAGVAQFIREAGNEATSDALLARQAAGQRISRYPPLGKMINGKRLLDNPDELRQIAQIKAIKEETGMALDKLTALLAERGVRLRGKPPSRKMVWKSLRFILPVT